MSAVEIAVATYKWFVTGLLVFVVLFCTTVHFVSKGYWRRNVGRRKR